MSELAVPKPWEHAEEETYRHYILLFVYACVIYSLIGFSWGAIMGGISEFRHFVDHRVHGDLIVRAHTHVNLLGWVEMAIFASIYYIIPRIIRKPIFSLKLVKVHFWIHNVGLIGMVVFFTVAGIMGGTAGVDSSPEEVEKIVAPILATMGIFGTLVVLANFIWAYNIYRTCAGWRSQK